MANSNYNSLKPLYLLECDWNYKCYDCIFLKGCVVMGSSGGCGVTILLLFCLWGVFFSLSSAARLSVSRQKLEVAKHLNRLNKSPVKTIQVSLSLSLSYFCVLRCS